ncbi:MAG: AraC family transcriptional regulator [Clostridia bacterium]|nr:AraC family transcriptional regulator [Clostridia bacterium]
MQGIKYDFKVYQQKMKTHTHSFGQLIIPIRGSLNIETDTMDSIIDENKLFFLSPSSEHTFYSKVRNEFLVLDIPYEFLKDDDMKKNQDGKLIEMDERWQLLKSLLIKDCQEDSNHYAVNNLFQYFYQYLVESSHYRSIDYLNQHYTEEISLNTLAKIENYNPNYYSEWFKKEMKVSITDYIKNLRVKKAKEMLIHHDYSILQIAQMVGYHHHSSLTRAFKDVENMTPAQFRKINSKSI